MPSLFSRISGVHGIKVAAVNDKPTSKRHHISSELARMNKFEDKLSNRARLRREFGQRMEVLSTAHTGRLQPTKVAVAQTSVPSQTEVASHYVQSAAPVCPISSQGSLIPQSLAHPASTVPTLLMPSQLHADLQAEAVNPVNPVNLVRPRIKRKIKGPAYFTHVTELDELESPNLVLHTCAGLFQLQIRPEQSVFEQQLFKRLSSPAFLAKYVIEELTAEELMRLNHLMGSHAQRDYVCDLFEQAAQKYEDKPAWWVEFPDAAHVLVEAICRVTASVTQIPVAIIESSFITQGDYIISVKTWEPNGRNGAEITHVAASSNVIDTAPNTLCFEKVANYYRIIR